MRKTIVLALVLLLFSCGKSKSPRIEVNSTDIIIKNESFTSDTLQNKKTIEVLDNWLTIKINDKVILKKLGYPEVKGENEYWDATGTFIQRWEYINQGIVLEMESNEEHSEKSVFSIIIEGACKMKTSQNIKINSRNSEVINVYDENIDKGNSNDTVVIVGSIYEGTIFYISDSIVNKIFIGGLAE